MQILADKFIRAAGPLSDLHQFPEDLRQIIVAVVLSCELNPLQNNDVAKYCAPLEIAGFSTGHKFDGFAYVCDVASLENSPAEFVLNNVREFDALSQTEIYPTVKSFLHLSRELVPVILRRLKANFRHIQSVRREGNATEEQLMEQLIPVDSSAGFSVAPEFQSGCNSRYSQYFPKESLSKR